MEPLEDNGEVNGRKDSSNILLKAHGSSDECFTVAVLITNVKPCYTVRLKQNAKFLCENCVFCAIKPI